MVDPAQAEQAARHAAEEWLSHIDSGNAEESWSDAASAFRDAVTQDAWAASLGKVQRALGRPLHRVFRSAEYHTELPGAPDGHYVVLKYDTKFEHKERGEETVVPQLDRDDVWRVSGYFVK